MHMARTRKALLSRLEPRDDAGIAMLTVLLAMLIVTTMSMGALTYAGNAMTSSRRSQDYHAALAAAQAGVDDYRRHLNVNDTYWTNAGVDTANAAFSTTGRAIPGASGSTATYHYSVLTTPGQTASSGLIRVSSTGTVGKVSRTVVADLRKIGFLKYGLFDIEETIDPAQYADLGDNQGYDYWAAKCGTAPTSPLYNYTGRSGCSDLYFGPDDVVNGPFHTNDTPMVGGHPQFKDQIAETSDTNCQTGSCYRQAYGGSSPATGAGNYPIVYGKPLTMPPTNAAIRDQADGNLGGQGCLYTGPTKITLNSVGTMDVTSPYTKQTNSGCGPGTGLSLPVNGVVYVQGIPTSSSDPNYTAIGSCPAQVLGQYPQTGDNVTQTGAQKYDCHAGDVFVQGTLHGQLTIAAGNSVIITGNTKYRDGTTGSDILGLVANNYVSIYHPVKCDGGSLPQSGSNAAFNCTNLGVNGSAPLTGVEVDAAVLSVQHCFTIQNPGYGPSLSTPGNEGTYRHVVGSVIEFFGAFSSIAGKTGYSDKFDYDRRLLTLPPPYFLQPVAAPWAVASFAEKNN